MKSVGAVGGRRREKRESRNDVYDRKSFNDTHPPTMHCTSAQSNALQFPDEVRQA